MTVPARPAFHPSDLTLPDELLLLALRESGSAQNNSQLEYALAGATLIELVLQERVRTDDKRVLLVSAEPTGHPACDLVLEQVRADDGHKLNSWIRRLHRKLKQPTATALQRRELIQVHDAGFGPFTWHRYPRVPNQVEPAIVNAVAAAMNGQPTDDRTAILALLLDSARLLRARGGDIGFLNRRARIREFEQRDYASPAVGAAVKATREEIASMEAAGA